MFAVFFIIFYFLLKFRMWLKYGLKAQKLLAQGVWSLHAKLELFSLYNLPPKFRFLLETIKKTTRNLQVISKLPGYKL